jgi:hypothetical protein
VFVGTRAVRADPWTNWSRARRAMPVPGPRCAEVGDNDLFRSGRDAAQRVASADDAFESARQKARKALASARASQKTGAPKDGEIGVVRVDAPPEVRPVPDSVVKRFASEARVFEIAGRYFARSDAKNGPSLSFLEGDRVVTPNFEPDPGALGDLAVSHDGSTAYVCSDSGNLYAVAIPAATVTVAFRTQSYAEGQQRGVECMRDGAVLLLTDKALHRLEPHGAGLQLASSLKAPSAFRLVKVSDGIFVSGTLGSTKTKAYVFGIRGGDMKVLARLTIALNPYSLEADGGRAFGTVDDADESFEIVNLGEAYDAAFPSMKPSQSATAPDVANARAVDRAKTKATSRPAKVGPVKLKLQKTPRIPWMDLQREGVDDVACAEVDARGALVGLANADGHYEVVRALGGDISRVALPPGDFGLSVREDGAVALAFGPELYEIDLATMRAKKLRSDVAPQYAAHVGDAIVIAGDAAIALCGREGDHVVARSRATLGTSPFALGVRGRAVVVPTDTKEKTPVFVVDGDTLRPVGFVKEQVNAATGCGRVLLLSGPKGTYEFDPASVGAD